jgi:S-adenosylmethionine:tRNA ribosyltransferase-isomerase
MTVRGAFTLPAELEAREPPEARGIARDRVRMMVSFLDAGRVEHTSFESLAALLDPGDLLLVNTSRTVPAAVTARRRDGTPVAVHFCSALEDALAVVELRQVVGERTRARAGARPGERLSLPGGAHVTVHHRHLVGGQPHDRLWLAGLDTPPWGEYLARHGKAIRYSYVERDWPLECYQTVYGRHPGSAEMPSAGRPFTRRILHDLAARGVALAPLLLHTGVASLEADERPYAEYYRVSSRTAAEVNARGAAGRRVIAVGTTAARALETVAAEDGSVRAGEGWTDLVLTAERPFRAASGLLTGLHEPRATHLSLLEALAGPADLELAYGEALAQGYLWHEFGDVHLLLGRSARVRA